MPKKAGRPKSKEKRIYRGCQFRESTWEALESLVARYREETPGCLTVNNRTVLEALIEYATSREIPFSELVGLTAAVGAESEE